MQDFLYDTRLDAGAFGDQWCGLSRLPHRVSTLVACYPATSVDGASVKVLCTALPAKFYDLQVAATDRHPAYTVSTGSGQTAWVAATAALIAAGMVSLSDKKPL